MLESPENYDDADIIIMQKLGKNSGGLISTVALFLSTPYLPGFLSEVILTGRTFFRTTLCSWVAADHLWLCKAK